MSSRVKSAETATAGATDDQIVTAFETKLGTHGAGLNAADRLHEFNAWKAEAQADEESKWGNGIIAAIMKCLFNNRWDKIEKRLESHFT